MFGKYTHFQNSAPNDISETWLTTQESDSNIQILTVKYATPQQTIDASCRILQNRILELHYTIREDADEIVSGVYRLADKALYVSRTFRQKTKLDDTIPHNGALILDCPFVSTKGYTLTALNVENRMPVFAPLLHLSDRAGDLSKRSLRGVQEGERITLNNTEIVTTRYEYGYEYWVNDDTIVLRAISAPHQYEIVLTEYDPN